MNIVLLQPDEPQGNQITLVDYRAEHIVSVLRSNIGDTIKVGIINGKTGYGIIKNLTRSKPRSVALQLVMEREPPARPAIDFIIALPRPIMFRRILSQLAALGCGHLYVVNASRVEKSFWEASIIADGTWEAHLRAGLEQAGDTIMPGLSFHRGFKPFIEQEFGSLAPSYGQMLVADPSAEAGIREAFRPASGRMLAAIGPEGGWVPYEIERLHIAGFAGFHIGTRILKVETAVTAVHAMLSLLLDS